jgi:hypothetical protein
MAADPAATARCPHCNESFALAAMLEQAIPQLEVIGGESPSRITHNFGNPFANQGGISNPINGQADTKDEKVEKVDGKFVVAPQLAAGAKRRRHRRVQASQSAAAVNGSGHPLMSVWKATVAAQSVAGRSQSQSGYRRIAPRRTTAAEGIKIAAGALLALPVAQLLIWWFIGADPLNLGGSVSRIAPFAVPRTFHEADDLDRDSVAGKRTENAANKPSNVLPASSESPIDGQ